MRILTLTTLIIFHLNASFFEKCDSKTIVVADSNKNTLGTLYFIKRITYFEMAQIVKKHDIQHIEECSKALTAALRENNRSDKYVWCYQICKWIDLSNHTLIPDEVSELLKTCNK